MTCNSAALETQCAAAVPRRTKALSTSADIMQLHQAGMLGVEPEVEYQKPRKGCTPGLGNRPLL
eukprot:3410647-Rhodomonas_salina.1